MSSNVHRQLSSEGQKQHKILITVGTTEFDGLVQYCCSASFTEVLKKCGLEDTPIIYQIGTTGKYIPQNANYFRLSNDIQKVYDEHDIIFTHGGAGTLLACLKSNNRGKKIIAVANTSLADNHQIQLISKLYQEGFILGFESVNELRNNEEKLIKFLTATEGLKKFQSESQFILNRLVFGQKS